MNNSPETHDLVLSGMGSAAGGDFRNVIINGKGTINGDIVSVDIQCNGMGDFNGQIKTGSIRVRGKATIQGNIEADKLKSEGETEIGGSLSAKILRVEGSLSTDAGAVLEEATIRGAFKAREGCGAESFDLRGVLTVGGLLNAGKIDIELYGRSQAFEIGGETIQVRRGKVFRWAQLIRSLFAIGESDPWLQTQTIEGDEIFLEDTTAKVVRGRNITIGSGCEIERVEYTGSLQKIDGGKVTEEIKA